MRESIIVPGEPLVTGQGWYRTRDGSRVYLIKNHEQWLDNLPWCVYRPNTDGGVGDYASFTCDDEGRVFPDAPVGTWRHMSAFDVIRKE